MKEHGILFKDRAVRAAASRIGVALDVYVAAVIRGEKFCGGCKRALARNADNFGQCKRGDGLRSKCRTCEKSVERSGYWKNHARRRAKQLEYQRANRDRLYAYNAKWSRERNRALREELLAAYGAACACCGEKEAVFLDLDHVNNNGSAHRREVGNNTQVALELRRLGWPRGDFQLLCCNCNQGKARNGGVCPHVSRRSL